jgi:hypothetical protein
MAELVPVVCTGFLRLAQIFPVPPNPPSLQRSLAAHPPDRFRLNRHSTHPDQGGGEVDESEEAAVEAVEAGREAPEVSHREFMTAAER